MDIESLLKALAKPMHPTAGQEARETFDDLCRRVDEDPREQQRIQDISDLIEAEDALYEQAVRLYEAGDFQAAEPLLRRASEAGILGADDLLAEISAAQDRNSGAGGTGGAGTGEQFDPVISPEPESSLSISHDPEFEWNFALAHLAADVNSAYEDAWEAFLVGRLLQWCYVIGGSEGVRPGGCICDHGESLGQLCDRRRQRWNSRLTEEFDRIWDAPSGWPPTHDATEGLSSTQHLAARQFASAHLDKMRARSGAEDARLSSQIIDQLYRDRGKLDRPEKGGRAGAIRIVVFGAPASGKTTLISALVGQAIEQSPWNVSSRSPSTATWISESVRLLEEGFFPASTRGVDRLELTLSGAWSGRTHQTAEINLEILDLPGASLRTWAEDQVDGAPLAENEHDLSFGGVGVCEWKQPRPRGLGDPEELAEHLATCDGIIFLFDPISEHQDRDNYRAMTAILNEVMRRTRDEGKNKTRLPQHLAVCVSKFDDPRVATEALRPDELTELGRMDEPKVSSQIAQRYFHELAARRLSEGAQRVQDAITSAFDPHRVRFYATSSIGFYAKPGQRLDPDNFSNLVIRSDETRIRGEVVPMNVLEPVVEMASRIHADRT